MEIWHEHDPITREDFERKCLQTNTLGLVKGLLKRSDGWEECTNWIKDGEFNSTAFTEFVGDELIDSEVDIITSSEEEGEYRSEDSKIRLIEFLNTLKSTTGSYLKDWHLQQKISKQFYQLPTFLGHDWLNEYQHNTTDKSFGDGSDYRFVYLGSDKSSTPFHVDVFGSYSWSVNLIGIKEWWFTEPCEVSKLGMYPDQGIFIQKHLEIFSPPPNTDDGTVQELLVNTERGGSIRVLRFFQYPGDLVFVPSGWGHHVWNHGICLSVNHNWCNKHNIVSMTKVLVSEVSFVIRQLSDCRLQLEEEPGGFSAHCEWLLHNSSNWNIATWLSLLHFSARQHPKAAPIIQNCLELLT